MSVPGVQIGMAAIQRIDQGEGEPLTLPQAVEQVEHLSSSKSDLLEAIAYLACQVVGYRHRANQDAELAMVQVECAVNEYRRRHP